MKATEQYFPVVLFITLYKGLYTFEAVDETLQCDQSSKSYWAVGSCDAFRLKFGSFHLLFSECHVEW